MHSQQFGRSQKKKRKLETHQLSAGTTKRKWELKSWGEKSHLRHCGFKSNRTDFHHIAPNNTRWKAATFHKTQKRDNFLVTLSAAFEILFLLFWVRRQLIPIRVTSDRVLSRHWKKNLPKCSRPSFSNSCLQWCPNTPQLQIFWRSPKSTNTQRWIQMTHRKKEKITWAWFGEMSTFADHRH